jgi:hypothetical protein
MVLSFLKNFRIADKDISKTIFCLGDWNNFGHGMKGNVCTKGSGFLDILRRWGIQCFYVWEARTSKMCSNCMDRDGEMKYCRKVYSPKLRRKRQPLRETGKQSCHGLLRCTRCHTMWNRDYNAARNIWMLAYFAIKGTEHNEPGITPGQRCRPPFLRVIRAPTAAAAAANLAAAAAGPVIQAVVDDSDDDLEDELIVDMDGL